MWSRYPKYEATPLTKFDDKERAKELTPKQKEYIEDNVSMEAYVGIRLNAKEKEKLLLSKLTERESKEFTRIMQSQNASSNNYLSLGKDAYRDNIRSCYTRAEFLFRKILTNS